MMPISGKGEPNFLLYPFYILLDRNFLHYTELLPQNGSQKSVRLRQQTEPYQILEDLSLNYGTMSGKYGDGPGIVVIKTGSAS